MAMETCECRSSNGRSLGPEVQITSSTVQPSPWARTRPVRRPRAPLRASRARACSRATAIFAKTSPRKRRMMLARSESTEKVTHTGGHHERYDDRQDGDSGRAGCDRARTGHYERYDD